MTEETKQPTENMKKTQKPEVKPLPVDKEKANQIEQNLETKLTDTPKQEKKQPTPEKKKEKIEIPKKEEAIARGASLPLSKKQCMYICSFIKNKSIDVAIADLEQVKKMKKAVPFKGEIPHRKGMGSGRYPVKAAGYVINLLKGLKGNVLVNGMDLDKTKISIASASWAARPLRSGGKAAKRTNIILKAKEVEGGKK